MPDLTLNSAMRSPKAFVWSIPVDENRLAKEQEAIVAEVSRQSAKQVERILNIAYYYATSIPKPSKRELEKLEVFETSDRARMVSLNGRQLFLVSYPRYVSGYCQFSYSIFVGPRSVNLKRHLLWVRSREYMRAVGDVTLGMLSHHHVISGYVFNFDGNSVFRCSNCQEKSWLRIDETGNILGGSVSAKLSVRCEGKV